jgi:signal transduction histidine kinase
MFLVLLLFLLSFLVYFIVKNHKKQEQIARQEADIQKQKWEDAENRRQIELLDSLIKGEETERTRIARDLHDGLGGLLSGVRMSIEALKKELQLAERQGNKLDSALIMLDNATAEMRSVAHNMMPDALQRFGLEKALSDFCFALSSRTAIEIHFSSQQLQLPAGHPVCIPVYRIVQELVNNALKHSQARQIIIQISQNESILLLEIEDNGVGFEPGDIENKKGSGFTNLKNRIQYLKGKLEIRSKPGSGTAFYMEIPV